MKNVYKTRIYRVLVNLVFGAAAALFVAFIASIWLKGFVWFLLISIGVFAAYIWLVIIDNMIVIETEDNVLTVKRGKKIDTYPIDTTAIRAKTVTSDGDTECTLYLTPYGGQEVTVDCELIGISQFESLLDDLGITRDAVTKLNTGNTADDQPAQLTTVKEQTHGQHHK